MNNQRLGSLCGTIVLLVLFAIPSSALSLEQQFIRYDFDSNVSETQRVNFVDNKYNDFKTDDLTGVIYAGQLSGIAVLEGESTTIDDQVSNLKNNSTVQNVARIDTRSPASPEFDYLWSQTEQDPRGQASTDSYSQYKRVYLRIEVDSSADKVDLLDEYHDDVAADGIGGAFIGGSGWGLIGGSGWGLLPTVLEGPKSEVNDWIDKMKADSRFTEVTTVQSVITNTQLYPELWSHSDGDARSTTK